MITWQEEVFKALAPIDIFNIFPADPGGCSCKECDPWPMRGFWRVAKPLGDRIHEISPKTEIWVDTWHLNHPTFGGKDWKNLVDSLNWTKERPDWFAGFEVALAPHHRFAKMSGQERDYYNKAKQRRKTTQECPMSKGGNRCAPLFWFCVRWLSPEDAKYYNPEPLNRPTLNLFAFF